MIVFITIAILCPHVSPSPVHPCPQPATLALIHSVTTHAPTQETCAQMCQNYQGCKYYNLNTVQDQCDLYSSCPREVMVAGDDCIPSKATCIGIMPHIPSKEHCHTLCMDTVDCSVYTYLSGTESPDVCSLYSSCSDDQVTNTPCPITLENILAVKLFTQNREQCRDMCRGRRGCRYYYWYPISYSPAPLYCYLYSHCTQEHQVEYSS